MPGLINDGSHFIGEAITLGASAIITKNKRTENDIVPHIIVDNPRKTLSKVAAKFYGEPSKSLKVIGITGTNGKTTTASLIHSIFKEAKVKIAQIGTLGIKDGKKLKKSALTTPDAITLQKTFSNLLKDNFTHVVMEVSSHSLAQHRVDDIDFDVAIFTNLTTDHLDYHKNMESYFLAKSKLFKMLGQNATAIINNSSIFGKRIIKRCKSKNITYSIEGQSEIFFEKVKIKMDGIDGFLRVKDKNYRVKSSLIGEFQL